MNSRERFLNTCKFKNVDRIPLIEWGIREATLREWRKQGLPENVAVENFADLDPYPLDIRIKLGCYPPFEEKILKEEGDYKIWIDSEGATRLDFKENKTPGFVTRKWLKFPVENYDDFLEMKKRYIPSYERYPENWENVSKFYRDISAPVGICGVPFLFWTVRQWMGLENLCLCIYDNPKFLEEMLEFITEFLIETLSLGIKDTKIDIAILSEDMAYKLRPMISPEIFKKFMMKHYKRFIEFLKKENVDIVIIDCDGYPGPLIPLWIEAGVDGFSPVEIAAGNDPVKLRKEYPEFILLGGIDKRILAKTEKDIYEEIIKKVPLLIEKGGYIPHVDHAIPPDVPLKNFIYYRKILSEIACS